MIWGMKQLPMTKHIAVTVGFGLLSVIMGISVTNVSVVFGLLGSTTYPLLGNILPAVFFLKLVPAHKYPRKRRLCAAQAVFVGLISVLSVMYNVYQIAVDDKALCA